MDPVSVEGTHRGRWCLALASLLLIGCVNGASRPARSGLIDLDGHDVEPLASATGPTVFVFTTTQCPISNRYAPEIARLHERFAPHDVAFWLVYADPADDPATIGAHRAAYAYPCAALRDPEHTLVARTGVTVTPEVAVFDADGTMLYRGRIDDRFVAFGRTRPAPTERDLETVLDAVVHGRPITPRTTEAIGCFIP